MYVLGIYRSLISASLNSHDRPRNRFFNLRNGEIPRGRRKGTKPEKAVFTTISNTGRAIMTSGLTMAGGFAAMMISSFPMRDFGFVCVLSIIFSLIAALTLVPAFLVFMDHRKMKRAATTIASPTTGGSSSL
ncbi:MAG: hypothetical protein DRO98_06070 [Archaeoglobales archaeon]|nr:MAG: hypothetical protein DRO98_06070 [Archaeoglobales archaeon]